MIINNNLMAMNAHRQLSITNSSSSKSMEKLSSGLRINRAGDDAAGLSISEKMRGQIRGLNQASRNAQDGISLIQTAEGALQETHSILQRMRELAVQSANDTNVVVDREAIQAEIDELAAEITRIANNTEFNTQNLLNGKFNGTFHIGANEGQDITLSINAMDASALKVAGEGGIKSKALEGLVAEAENPGKTNNTFFDTAANVGKTLDVNKLDTNVTIKFGTTTTDDVEVGYVVTDNEGKVQALVSKDGKDYYILKDSATYDDISKVKAGTIADGDFTEVSFQDAVVDGKIKLVAEGGDGKTLKISGDATIKFIDTSVASLGSGTYKVSTTHKLLQPNTIGIVNEKGDLVAVSKDDTGTGFVDMNGKDLFTSGTALTIDGLELNIRGDGGIDVSSQSAASKAITTINKAIETVSAERSKLGAYQNRLEHTIKNLDTSAENLQASESRIRDVDMAKEMMEFTKNNILQQAAQAMLAQANQAPQGVLQLLR